MSTQAMKWAWDVVPGSATGRLVLLALAEHSDPAGISYPSIKRIAQFAMTSEGTVKRRLKEFEAAGVVAVFDRTDPKSGRTTSNEYRLALHRDPAGIVITGEAARSTDDAPEEAEAGQGEGSMVDPSPPWGGSHPGESGEGVTQVNPLEPSEGNITPLPPDEPGETAERVPFATFRLRWPVPLGTDAAAAELLWDALKPGEMLRVIATIPEWQRCCGQRGGPRLGKASTFLRSRTFDDPALLPKPKPVTVFVAEDSEAWRAWTVFARCFGRRSLSIGAGPNGGRGWYFPSEWPAFGRDLPLPNEDPARPWVFIRFGSQQSGAWHHALAAAARPPAWPDKPPREKGPGGEDGFWAPSLWPPRKDGSVATGPPDDVENFVA